MDYGVDSCGKLALYSITDYLSYDNYPSLQTDDQQETTNLIIYDNSIALKVAIERMLSIDIIFATGIALPEIFSLQ